MHIQLFIFVAVNIKEVCSFRYIMYLMLENFFYMSFHIYSYGTCTRYMILLLKTLVIEKKYLKIR